MATFDRVAQNAKELTVSRGEYLEVLDDAKNWWECRNVHQRVGYVPHTILSVVPLDQADPRDTYINSFLLSLDLIHENCGSLNNGCVFSLLDGDCPAY
ncbi:unnamed protein product [Cylicostephanus goldi]|uniref:SH3 domain-containing protein n=1 Tax=Cylicostephanus goldi TaxID=71465 RepID=A0A3P6T2J5_CYLGO|nr:unnamed protein product [Cylicostephanus goldi]